MNMIDTVFDKGDISQPNEEEMWIGGIDAVSIHGHMIEVYGDNYEDTEKKRDFVLKAICHYQDMIKIWKAAQPMFNYAKDDEIMVFGSNLAGRHGAGAARYALENKGAVYGIGEGLQGMSYALPTKGWQIEEISLEEIKKHVDTFIKFAKEHSELKFFVTRVGCGLAGHVNEDIAPMFVDALSNCRFEDDWKTIIEDTKSGGSNNRPAF